MYALTSEMTPWLLPLPDFLVIWLIFSLSPLLHKSFDSFLNLGQFCYLGIFLSYLPTEYSSVRITIANESKFGLGVWDKSVQNNFILTTINNKAIGDVDNFE
jgi:hypothetical protein